MSTLRSQNQPTKAEVSEQLDRMLAMPALRSSANTNRLLRFLVEQTLAGRSGQLKQHTIAHEVLGLGPNFDPDKNPIVRIQIGRARRALQKYYAGPGAMDYVVFSIPQGSYDIKISRATPPVRRRPKRAMPRPVIGVTEFLGLGLEKPWDTLPYVLAEELTMALGRLEELRVLGPFMRSRLLLEGKTTAEVCRQHGVDFLIDGSLEFSGRQYALRVRLLEGATGYQIWGETYRCGDGRSCNLADMQTDLLQRLAAEVGTDYGALHRHLSALALVKPERSLTVYEAVVTARVYFHQQSVESLRRAVKVLRSTTKKFPDESLLHALLSLVLAGIPIEPLWRGSAPMKEIAAHAERSYILDPLNGWSALALGITAVLRGEAEELSRFSRRLQDDPRTPKNLLGGMGLWMCYRKVNREDGLRFIDEACALNPHIPGVLRLGPCLVALESGDLKKATRELDAYGYPDGWMDSLLRATMAALAGEVKSAQTEWRRFLRHEPDFAKHGFRRVRLLLHDDYVSLSVRALRAAGVKIPASKWPLDRTGGRGKATPAAL